MAAAKKQLAARLVARGRLWPALDALNQVIQMAPADPEAFLARAGLFERLGMHPQAEADRRRAQELAGSAGLGLPEPPPVAPPPSPAEPTPAPAPARQPAPTAATRQPAVAGRRPWVWIAALGFAALLAGGIIVAAVALQGNGGGSSGSVAIPGETSPPATTGGAAATRTATPSPTRTSAGTVGGRLSLADVQRGWEAEGMTVSQEGAGAGFGGFSVAAVDFTLRRAGQALRVSVFVYANRDAPGADWDLVIGSAPSPRAGRTLPGHISIWWNESVVVVVRDGPPELNADAREAFLGL
ncbi:MAG: hypothetical protein HYY03_06085 [Chloroflexi bacterium]|nr:hypothetical protein [Chloroflexota bacterium]